MNDFPTDKELVPELALFPDLDSRLGEDLRKRRTKAGIFGSNMEYCFCCSCHKAAALVTSDTPVIYLCDDCTDKYGGLPLVEVSPEDGSVTLWRENITPVNINKE
jgi:hypothetical protein